MYLNRLVLNMPASKWKPFTLEDNAKILKKNGWDVRVIGESLQASKDGFSVIYWQDGELVRCMPKL